VKALCGMFIKSWVILGFNRPIVCYKHNITGVGCNYMFNNLFVGVWCVTKCGHIQCTYTSFATNAHHGTWVLMEFKLCQFIEFDNAT